MTISVDLSEVRQLERKLNDLNKRGLKHAEAATLNRMAFETQRHSKTSIKHRMTTRNTWTERSVRVQKATLRHQQAEVGSTEGYMAKQELGGHEDATGRHGVVIPTPLASGEAEGTRPRQKLVRRPNTIRRIKLHGRASQRTPKSKKQELLFKVQDAVWTGRRLIYHDTGRRKGIFRVKGGNRRFKRGWPRGAKLKMMHDMTHKTISIPATPWLMPNARAQENHAPSYYRSALSFQLKRLS